MTTGLPFIHGVSQTASYLGAFVHPCYLSSEHSPPFLHLPLWLKLTPPQVSSGKPCLTFLTRSNSPTIDTHIHIRPPCFAALVIAKCTFVELNSWLESFSLDCKLQEVTYYACLYYLRTTHHPNIKYNV